MTSLVAKIQAREAAKQQDGANPSGQAAAVAGRMREDQIDRAARVLMVSQIRVKPQARKTFEDLDELAASIKSRGQLQPIIVIEVDPFNYDLAYGERRLRAIRDVLQEDMILARVVDNVGDATELRLSQLHENIHRNGYKPFELADEFDSLMKDNKWSQDELAARVGVSKSWASKRLSLLKAPPEIQAAIKSGEMAETDYYNNKEQKKAEVATKRDKPEGEGGAAGSAPTTPKNFSMPWAGAVEHAGIVAALMKRAGFKDVEISPEPDKEELTAFYARVKEIWGAK